jgi:hypothetical protein
MTPRTCAFPDFVQGRAELDDRCDNVHCPAWEDCSGIFESEEEAHSPFFVVLVGPLSDDPVGFIGNVRRFCDVAADLMLAGYAPLNPATDLLEAYASPALGIKLLQRRSLDVLRLVSMAPPGRRAAFCIGTENGQGQPSYGALRELEECVELGVPIVRTMTELRDMRGSEP